MKQMKFIVSWDPYQDIKIWKDREAALAEGSKKEETGEGQKSPMMAALNWSSLRREWKKTWRMSPPRAKLTPLTAWRIFLKIRLCFV